MWPDSLEFSPDGRVLVVTQGAGGGATQILNAGPTGFKPYPAPARYSPSMAFTPDSRMLITNIGHDVVLWPLTGNPHATHLARGLSQQVQRFAVSPDGALVAALDESRNIRLWDLANTTLLGTISSPSTNTAPPPAGAPPGELLFGADSRSLMAFEPSQPPAQGDGQTLTFTLWRWSLDLASWKRRACTIANRNLTRAEWARYGGTSAYEETCPNFP